MNRQSLRDGVLLGSILFFQTMCALKGLETISASRSAFIIGLSVILVPFLGALMGKRLPGRVLFAASLAIMGMSAMSWDGGGLRVGDLLMMASAIGIAIYIVVLETIAPRHESLPLAAVRVWFVFVLSGLWALPEMIHQGVGIGDRFPSLLYLGLVVTIGPLWGQAVGQRWIPAHEAALLYTLEPVFATFFSVLLLGEGLTLNGAIGAAFILMATAVSQLASP